MKNLSNLVRDQVPHCVSSYRLGYSTFPAVSLTLLLGFSNTALLIMSVLLKKVQWLAIKWAQLCLAIKAKCYRTLPYLLSFPCNFPLHLILSAAALASPFTWNVFLPLNFKSSLPHHPFQSFTKYTISLFWIWTVLYSSSGFWREGLCIL